jgi:RHS repeat-associated protein
VAAVCIKPTLLTDSTPKSKLASGGIHLLAALAPRRSTRLSPRTHRGYRRVARRVRLGRSHHMNGRVYDPTIGRFLSADPIIQTSALSQAINPFSYVMNMPLTLTDPSGLSWLSKLFSGIGSFFKKFGATIISVAFTLMGMPYIGMFLSSAFSAAVNGGNFLQNFAIGLAIGAVTGAIGGYAAGGIAKGLGINAGSIWGQVFRGAIAGAVAGGLGAAAFGGDVWAGMLGGAVTGAIVGGIIGKYRANILARAEKDGFVTYGDKAQQQAMREFSQSPEGQRYLMDIMAAKVKVTLSWSEDNAAQSSYSREDRTQDISLPENMSSFMAASGQPSIALATVLAHEAGHFYTAPSSTITEIIDASGESTITVVRDPAAYRAAEVGASRWENGFRLWSSVGRRQTYGDFSIPQSTCLICSP